MLIMRRVFVISIVAIVMYLSSIFLLSLNSASMTIDTLMMTTTTTTTTTTPTPFKLFLNKTQNIDRPNVTIEKYDAIKVHTKIMTEKIRKMMTGASKYVIKKPNLNSPINKNVHMMYFDTLKSIFSPKAMLKLKHNSSVNFNIDQRILRENIKAARSMGAGVLIMPYPYVPIVPQIETSENIFNTVLNLAMKFNITVGIAIKENFNRNILSIRRDIFHFIEAYKNHPALYKYKKDDASKSVPIIYIMDTYTTPSNKWKELLSENGQLTIRNSDIDAIVLGHLQDEEHSYHLKQSNFDGFFTCCSNNGESFGNTWKNWQPLSSWARSRSLISSIGVNEGSSGVLSVKAALNTLLRCHHRPDFVFINNMQFKDDYISLIQTWMEIWLNSSIQNKFL